MIIDPSFWKRICDVETIVLEGFSHTVPKSLPSHFTRK